MLETIKASFNEFLIMWIASLSPLLFGSLVVVMNNEELSYMDVLILSIEPDAIFAYVSTMIAPFFYVLYKSTKQKNNVKVGFSGTFIFIAISIAIITSGVFFLEKSEKFALMHNEINSESSVISHSSLLTKDSSIEDVKIYVDFKASILLLCYLLSLFTWFYAIYLNHKKPPDLEKISNDGVNKMLNDANSFFDGNN